jgi:uncharacterized protein YjdB
MRRALFASAVSLAAAALSAGCVIVDPGCGAGGASILVSPTVVFVSVGQSATPKATWCRNGHYDPFTPQWSLSSTADASIVSLDPATGRITGRRAGTATVIATSDGVDGASVSVTVR